MFTHIYIYRRRRGQGEGQEAAGGMTIRDNRKKDNKHQEKGQAAAGKTDKRQQEEGQEAAGGRTRSSRRKDKKQQEEGQEAAGGRTRGSLQLVLPLATSCPSSCSFLGVLVHTFSVLFFFTGFLKESQGDPSGTCTRNHGGT